MADGDLTTLESVKAFVGVTGNASDTVLQALITGASAWLSQFCNRNFAAASYTETRDGTGTPLLLTRESPIISITSLTIDGTPIPARANALPGSTGYVIGKPSTIALVGYRFSRGVGNVTIEYRAGFTPLPPDIVLFTKQIVAEQFRYKDRTGQSSANLQGQSISFKDEDVPKFVRTGLVEGGWKRVVMP